MKEHNTPQMECLQRIRDIAIFYDGNANRDCSQGDMKGLCKLIDEMRGYAESGLRGEWPDFIENDDTYWMIERKSLDGNAEWYCAGHDRWTKDANRAIHFPNNKAGEEWIVFMKLKHNVPDYAAIVTEHKNL